MTQCVRLKQNLVQNVVPVGIARVHIGTMVNQKCCRAKLPAWAATLQRCQAKFVARLQIGFRFQEWRPMKPHFRLPPPRAMTWTVRVQDVWRMDSPAAARECNPTVCSEWLHPRRSNRLCPERSLTPWLPKLFSHNLLCRPWRPDEGRFGRQHWWCRAEHPLKSRASAWRVVPCESPNAAASRPCNPALQPRFVFSNELVCLRGVAQRRGCKGVVIRTVVYEHLQNFVPPIRRHHCDPFDRLDSWECSEATKLASALAM